MKRLICLLLLALLPCLAAAEEPSLSITEVAAMTPEYYEGTCKLDGKRTIDFRAPVFVPDVESMPVVRVRHQRLTPEEEAQLKDNETIENEANHLWLLMDEEFRRMIGDGSGNMILVWKAYTIFGVLMHRRVCIRYTLRIRRFPWVTWLMGWSNL